jgi:hypothetical protein
MAALPARQPKQGKAGAPRRNVLRKAADSDVHPAEPRTGGGATSARARTSTSGRTFGGTSRTGGGRTARD